MKRQQPLRARSEARSLNARTLGKPNLTLVAPLDDQTIETLVRDIRRWQKAA
jgi:hypothetical protein